MRRAARGKVDDLGYVRDVCGSPTFEKPGIATEGQAFFILMEAAAQRRRRADVPMASRFPHLPLDQARPDAGRFIDVVMGRVAKRAPASRRIPDRRCAAPADHDRAPRPRLGRSGSRRPCRPERLSRQLHRPLARSGLRFRALRGVAAVRRDTKSSGPTPSLSRCGARHWRDMRRGAIAGWDDFERYPWPSVTPASLARYEYLATHLPEGMGLIACHAGGMYEHLAAIFSLRGPVLRAA